MSGPLAGVRVVVTRAAQQADELAAAFAAAGAAVERLPLLEVGPPADPGPLRRAAGEVERYGWVAFTSANAVDAFLPRVGSWPPATRVAAVGPATAAALRRAGCEPAVVAAEARGEGLAAALAPHLGPHLATGERVLLPQADDARPETAAALRALGVAVDVVVAYAKRRPAGVEPRVRALAAEPGAWWTVTSPRIARELADLAGPAWAAMATTARFVAVGPTTAAALERLGVAPEVASEPTPAAMVAVVVAATS